MFEYILLLAGVLLVVVLAIALLRGGLFQSSSANIDKAACVNNLVTSNVCYNSQGVWQWNAIVSFSTNACPKTLGSGAPYACCIDGIGGNGTNVCSPSNLNSCLCGPNPRP